MVFLVFVIVGLVFFAVGAEICTCISSTMNSKLPTPAKVAIAITAVLIGVGFVIGFVLYPR